MGFWIQDETGASFAESDRTKEPLIWGDQFADIVDDAIWQIRAAYLAYLGRPASKAEILAGLKFSTTALDGLADHPDNVPEVPTDDLAVVEEHYYAATRGDESTPQRVIDARKQIVAVLDRIEAPFKSHPDFTGSEAPDDIVTVVDWHHHH